MTDKENQLSRRDFLRHTALGTAALGAASLAGCGGGSGGPTIDPGVGPGSSGNGVGDIPGPNIGAPRSLVVEPSRSKQEGYYLSNNLYIILASAEQTGGLFTAFDFRLPPGGGPAPHVHSRESETFYSFFGDITETVNLTPVKVEPGSLLYGALGQPHAFKNTGQTNARLLSIVHPSGLEQLFRFAGKRATDFNAPIPLETQQQLQQTVEVSLHRGDRPFRPQDTPPNSPVLLDRVLTEPNGPIDPRVAAIHGIKGYLYPQRPRYFGPFGLQGLNLVGFNETNNTLSFNRFSLAKQSNLPAAIKNPDDQIFYPLKGTLTLTIAGREVVAPPDTFIYIKKGDTFSIANLGAETVDALAIVVRPGPNIRR